MLSTWLEHCSEDDEVIRIREHLEVIGLTGEKKWTVPTNPGFDNFCFLFFLSRLQMLGSVSIQLGFCSGETYIERLYCCGQIRNPTRFEDLTSNLGRIPFVRADKTKQKFFFALPFPCITFASWKQHGNQRTKLSYPKLFVHWRLNKNVW